MSVLFVDIETRMTDDPVVLERILASVRPPGSMKKADTIDAWWKEHGAQAKLEAIKKTALNGDYGKVAVIGYSIDGEEPQTYHGEEVQTLQAFSSLVDLVAPHMYVAFNADFDIRFLWKRMKIHGIHVPNSWPMKRYPDNLFDPMRAWAGYGEYISQTELERILMIDGPDDIDGSEVPELIEAGEWDKVIQHCKYDVAGLVQIYNRLK